MNIKMIGMLILATFAVSDGTAGQAFAGFNLVVNGDFETGNFNGFTVANQLSGTAVKSTFTYSNGITYVPHSGTYFAALGNSGSDATISQTISDVVGQSYVFSFFLASDGKLPNDFTAKWNGQTLLAATSLGASPYTQYSYTVLGTGSDTISFMERNDPGYLSLDDVSVVATSAVPEPSSLILTGMSSLAGLGYLLRKRQTRITV